MKKTLIISALAVSMLGTTALAQDFQQYVSGKGSILSLENKFTGTVDIYEAGTDAERVFDVSRNKSKTVGGFRLAYGLKLPVGSNAIRTEIEYGYNGKAKLSGNGNMIGDDTFSVGYRSQIKSQFIMANAYFDFNTGSEWTPYVGAGLGWARVKAENSLHFEDETDSISKSSNNFAWNLTAGVSYNVSSNLAIDASYRYADYGKVKTSYTYRGSDHYENINAKSKVKSNEFNLGFRYSF